MIAYFKNRQVQFHDLDRIHKVEWLFNHVIILETELANRAFPPFFYVTLEGIRRAEKMLIRLRCLRHRAIHLSLTLQELEFQAARGPHAPREVVVS